MLALSTTSSGNYFLNTSSYFLIMGNTNITGNTTFYGDVDINGILNSSMPIEINGTQLDWLIDTTWRVIA